MLNISAQTENGFKAVEVLDSFEKNPFTYFLDAPILAAGDKDGYNAMTIGWGGMGTLWGRNRPVVTVYVAYTKNGTPYFKEADAVIECEIMYGAPFEEKNFRNDVPKKTYSNFPAGIHSMYIGEVVGAWKK